MRVLRDHKAAIRWSLDDLKEIRPSICMHRILLEDGYKLSVEAQRRMNPTMKEVFRKEVLKWLDVGGNLPNFRQPMCKPDTDSSKERWNDS